MLVTDTLVSRSLGATFSELIGKPTPPKLQVPIPTTVAPVIGTTETFPSSVASSEPAPTVTPVESQVTLVLEQTHIALASLPAIEGQTTQSSG